MTPSPQLGVVDFGDRARSSKSKGLSDLLKGGWSRRRQVAPRSLPRFEKEARGVWSVRTKGSQVGGAVARPIQ